MSVPCCLHEWLIMHGVASIVYQAGVCVCKLLCNSIPLHVTAPSFFFPGSSGFILHQVQAGPYFSSVLFGGVVWDKFVCLIDFEIFNPQIHWFTSPFVNSVENATAVHAFCWHLKTGRKIDKSNTYNSWYWKFHFEIGKICLWWYVPHFKEKSISFHL